jgi:GNAT superfamily N-acetyltransferase
MVAGMDERELINRACETIAGFLALGNERFEAHGATFLRNRTTPRRQDVNTVILIRTEAPEFEALLTRAEAEYQGMSHRRFEVDPLTPPSIAARLTMEGGYKVNELLTLVLEGPIRAPPPQIEIHEVLTEADWAAYLRLDEMWWRESSTDYFGPYDPALHEELTASFRAKLPAVRPWLARVDGVDCAYLTSWPGDNGIGMVEDLYTEPAFRRRGIATALLVHCVADARERGAEPVVINADPHDTPKQLYASLGFQPLFLSRSYLKSPAE